MAITRTILSGSTDGKGIKITQTATAGDTIHTGSSTASDVEEIWIWAYNSHTAPVQLTLEWGGATDPDDHIVVDVPEDNGLILVSPGLPLKGNATPLVIRAFAANANVVTIHGYVNKLT